MAARKYAGASRNFAKLTKFQCTPAYLMMLKVCKLDKIPIVTANRQDYLKYSLGLPSRGIKRNCA